MHLVRLNSLRGFDRLFDSLAGSVAGSVAGGGVAHVPVGNAAWQPNADIREGKDSYFIALDVPAVEPKDITVAVNDGVLTIAGERAAEVLEPDTKVHRRERRSGKFSRSFTLPDDVDANAIEATAKAGVLTIRITKRAVAQPVSIEVKVV